RALLREPATVLLEQARGLQRRPHLALDGGHEELLDGGQLLIACHLHGARLVDRDLDAERVAELLRADLDDARRIGLAVHVTRELGDEALALDRARESGRGAQALEGDAGLRGDRLQQRELVPRERT